MGMIYGVLIYLYTMFDTKNNWVDHDISQNHGKLSVYCNSPSHKCVGDDAEGEVFATDAFFLPWNVKDLFN